MDEWISPPFEPEIRDNNIYARGPADDKGQTYILVKAVEGLRKKHGRLPVNLKFWWKAKRKWAVSQSYVAS